MYPSLYIAYSCGASLTQCLWQLNGKCQQYLSQSGGRQSRVESYSKEEFVF